jgi:hypothetical protein
VESPHSGSFTEYYGNRSNPTAVGFGNCLWLLAAGNWQKFRTKSQPPEASSQKPETKANVKLITDNAFLKRIICRQGIT